MSDNPAMIAVKEGRLDDADRILAERETYFERQAEAAKAARAHLRAMRPKREPFDE